MYFDASKMKTNLLKLTRL